MPVPRRSRTGAFGRSRVFVPAQLGGRCAPDAALLHSALVRSTADADRIRRFIEELGRRAAGPGRVYLTGGGTAVLFGWRNTTVDVDLKLDPEPPGVFDAILRLKDELDVNVELA